MVGTFGYEHAHRGGAELAVALPVLTLADFSAPGRAVDFAAVISVDATDSNTIYATSERGGTQSPVAGDLLLGESTTDYVTKIWRSSDNTTLRFNDSFPTELEAWALQTGLRIHLQVERGPGNDVHFESTSYTDDIAAGGGYVNWKSLPAAVTTLLAGLTNGQRLIVAATLPTGSDVTGTFGYEHGHRGSASIEVESDRSGRFGYEHSHRGGADLDIASTRTGTFGTEHAHRGSAAITIGGYLVGTFGSEHGHRGGVTIEIAADRSGTFGTEHAHRGSASLMVVGGNVVGTFGTEHIHRGSATVTVGAGVSDVLGTFGYEHAHRGRVYLRVTPANAAGGDDVTVSINGTPFPGVLFGTVSITRGIHRRAVLSATWRGRLSTLSRHPREGDLIEVTDNRTGRVIFGGHLNAPRLRVLPGNAKGDISLDSVGYYARLEQVQLDQERAIDVVEATTPADQVDLIVGALAGEGFTADVDVSGSATIEEDIRFRSLRDAVALLVELHGASVTVDTSRVVSFRDRDRAPDSGVTLDASNVERFTVERDRQHIRTSQRLNRGEVPTSEAFTGDGSTASWRLGGITDVVSDVDTATLVPGYPGAGASPGLLWRQTYLAFATDGLSGTEDRATFVARSNASGSPINAAYIAGDVPAFIGRLALSWDTADQPAGITVELNLHDQSSSGTPVDMFDSSIVWGYNDPLVAAPTDGAVLLIRNAAARNFHNITNAADLVIEGLPGLSYNATERFPPAYVEGGSGFVGVVSFRTQGRVRFQLGTSRHTTFGRGSGPSLTPEAHANLGLVFRITSGPNLGYTRSWRLADLVEVDDDEPYVWNLGTGEFYSALVDGHRVTGAFVDLSAGSGAVSLNGASFSPSDGSASGPDFTNRNDLGLIVAAGGGHYLLPLDAIAADDDEPYQWAATYDDTLISALSGDVVVALVDRSSPSVRWLQAGIVTERTRLSVVSIITVDEGGTDLVVEEDVKFNVARQRLTRVAGALPSGTILTVRYQADRVIEDSVSSDRAVHVTEHAEFDTASIGAARARAALDLYAQPALIIRATMRTGHDRHIGDGELVTLPAAQLRLMGIPGVTGDERWLVDEVRILGIGDLLSYTLRLVRGSASSSFVEFWRRRLAG